MRERFWRAYHLELRQIFRQWSYWLILALLTVYILSIFSSYKGYTAQEVLLSGASRNAIGLSTLIVLFLTAFSVGRARRSRMDVLEATLPTGAEIPLGRGLALITSALPLVVSPLLLGVAIGPFESFLRGLPTFLLESFLSLVLTAVLVWAIDATAGVRRWMYPVLGMLWIAAIAVSVMLVSSALGPWVPQWNFTGFGPMYYVEGWARLPIGIAPLLLNLFHFGCIILLIGLGVRGIERRRFYRTPRTVYMVVGTGGVIALAGYLLFGFNYINLRGQAQVDYMRRYSYQQEATLITFEPPVYNVSRYDIALDLTDTPTFTVSMDVHNGGAAALDSLVFSLMQSVEIESSSVAFTRDRNQVTFTPEAPLEPGETLTIDLLYGGDATRYMLMPGMPPVMEAFALDGGIYLPSEAQWYPRAGWIERNDEDTVFIRNSYTDEPADFRLQVSGAGMPVTSNLPLTGENTFAASGVTWVNLYGAPELEIHEPVEGYEIVTSKYQYGVMRDEVVAGLERIEPVASQYFPNRMKLIYIFPRYSTLYTPSYNSPQQTDGVGVMHVSWFGARPGWFYEFGAYEVGLFPRAQAFFGDMTTTQLTENVAQFVFLLVRFGDDLSAMRGDLDAREEVSGGRTITIIINDDGTTEQVRMSEEQELNYVSPGYAYNYGVAKKLIDVYELHGTDGVVALLNAMREEVATLRVTVTSGVVAWIDAWVAENLADA